MLGLFALGAATATADAADLEQVRVFVGKEHAQVLLITGDSIGQPEARSVAAVGKAPARATLLFSGLLLSDELRGAYSEQEGRYLIPVGRGGVDAVAMAVVGSQLQVSIETTRAREVSLTTLSERALLVDLVVPGVEKDASLPKPEMLARWIAGASLQRTSKTISEPRRLIVVDPGHGGKDSGALGVSGTHEADIALVLAKRVKKELERRLDADVVLTRDDDRFVSLTDRAAIANALDADLFVSIHANAAPAPTVWGIETYYLDGASDKGAARVAARENAVAAVNGPVDGIVTDLLVSGTNRLSRELATEIQEEVVAGLTEVYGPDQIRDLGVKAAVFAVLVSTRMPSVLFEAAFLTHPDDEMRVRHPVYQQTVAVAMADAVGQWFDSRGR